MAFCPSARRALALALMALIFLPSLSASVSAHVPSDPTPENDVFVIYRSEDGDTVCRKANEQERSQLDVPVNPKNLRQINHIADPKQTGFSADALPAHLTIILRATANLDANAPAKAAFIRAAANWENLVSTPVTIYIDVDYGPNNFGQAWPSGVLGSTSSPAPTTADYAALRNSLMAGANTPARSAVYTGLPASSLPTDLGSVNTVSIAKSIARAIGFSDPTSQPTDSAARIGFNSDIVTYDFDPSDGISGGTDFEAVATHEIGHALGFTSRSGSNPVNGLVTPAMWDLYRFRSGTTSGTFATAQRIMTIGGPTLNSQYYFVPGDTEIGLSNGGPDPTNDPNKSTDNSDGNQSSHWRQASLNGGYIGIMDPRIPSNTRRQITQNDINALNIFGYNSNGVVTTTPANDNFASAQVISGCSGSVTGTNVNATRESGEPVLFSPTSNRSVWYQWVSPSSGSVTFTTTGSGFDTILGVYTGSAVGALSQVVAPDDDDDPARSSTVTFTASAGTTYRIVVDGFNNSSSGGDAGPILLSWMASNCTAAQVQLSQSSYTVNEGASFLSVPVTRTGDTSGPVTLNYSTSDAAGLTNCTVNNGLASERCDYGTTVGTVRFAAGETSQSIIIPIVNDAFVEGNETFQLTVSSPMGATLVGSSSVTVTIVDNDAAGAQNPIDNIPFFVTQQYIDFLGRLPDATGFQNWVATLQGCPNGGFGENDNPGCDRVHVSAGFFLSPEFQGRGYFAYRFYEVALDRRPTYAEFVPDMALVGGSQSPDSEALSKTAYTDAWTLRPEFKARYDSLSNEGYVNALEVNAEVTVSNKQTLIDALNGGQMNRGQVLRNIVESQAVADRFFNRAFVAMQYFGYLRRDPDTVGFQNWVNTLNADPSNFRHMIFGFLFSTEYRQRFGQ
ncbi:MAG TPA: NF038122 family metalloprotease [Pyrinomonadaceae bacterium]|nr:NF038122 family metalloprotease [Pyrinomonadaceae bacterium]